MRGMVNSNRYYVAENLEFKYAKGIDVAHIRSKENWK